MSELLFRSQRLPAGGPGLICMRSAGFLVHRDVTGEGPGLGRSFVPNGSAACPGQPVALTGGDVDIHSPHAVSNACRW